jgi:hypothetical protein
MEHQTEPDAATHATEEADARRGPSADRPATEGERSIADDAYAKGDADERRRVARHEEEMMEIGAHIKGEGAIDEEPPRAGR